MPEPERNRTVPPLTLVMLAVAVVAALALILGAALDASSTVMAVVFAAVVVVGGITIALVARRAGTDRWRHLGVADAHRDAVIAALRTGEAPDNPTVRAEAVRAAESERARTKMSWLAAGLMGFAGVAQFLGAGDRGSSAWLTGAGFLAAGVLMALSAWTASRRYDRLIATAEAKDAARKAKKKKGR